MRTKIQWIDADIWLRYLHRQQAARDFDSGRALNFSEAEQLARMGGFAYEHQSDGSTLIEVGEMLARLAKT
jgi:NaMN:DMB phosphoribosyltransferase